MAWNTYSVDFGAAGNWKTSAGSLAGKAAEACRQSAGPLGSDGRPRPWHSQNIRQDLTRQNKTWGNPRWAARAREIAAQAAGENRACPEAPVLAALEGLVGVSRHPGGVLPEDQAKYEAACAARKGKKGRPPKAPAETPAGWYYSPGFGPAGKRESGTRHRHVSRKKVAAGTTLCKTLILQVSPDYFYPRIRREGPELWPPERLRLAPVEERGPIDQAAVTAWQEAAARWLQDRYGDALAGWELHMDERSPHIHAHIIPVMTAPGPDGKPATRLAGSLIFGDRDKKTSQDKAKELIESFRPYFEPLGLHRPTEGAPSTGQTYSQIYDDVRNLRQEKSRLERQLRPLQTALERKDTAEQRALQALEHSFGDSCIPRLWSSVPAPQPTPPAAEIDRILQASGAGCRFSSADQQRQAAETAYACGVMAERHRIRKALESAEDRLWHSIKKRMAEIISRSIWHAFADYLKKKQIKNKRLIEKMKEHSSSQSATRPAAHCSCTEPRQDMKS